MELFSAPSGLLPRLLVMALNLLYIMGMTLVLVVFPATWLLLHVTRSTDQVFKDHVLYMAIQTTATLLPPYCLTLAFYTNLLYFRCPHASILINFCTMDALVAMLMAVPSMVLWVVYLPRDLTERPALVTEYNMCTALTFVFGVINSFGAFNHVRKTVVVDCLQHDIANFQSALLVVSARMSVVEMLAALRQIPDMMSRIDKVMASCDTSELSVRIGSAAKSVLVLERARLQRLLEAVNRGTGSSSTVPSATAA